MSSQPDPFNPNLRRITASDLLAIRDVTPRNHTSQPAGEHPPGLPTVMTPIAPCPWCDGAGYYKEAVPVGHLNFGKLLPCVCKLAELEERAAAQQQARLIQLAGVAGRFATATLDGFEVTKRLYPASVEWYNLETLDRKKRLYTPAQQRHFLSDALNAARAYAANPSGGLLLQGPYGSGKTHLAYAVAHALVDRGYTLAADSVPALLEFIKAGFENDSASQRIQDLKTVDVLILDDVGTQRSTEWSEEQLYTIVNHRYVFGLWTLFTSNEPVVYFTGRIGSRIAEFAEVVPVIAYDYRLLARRRKA